MDLFETLAGVWAGFQQLRAHRGDPQGQASLIPMDFHEISIAATPTLTLAYDGVQLPALKLSYAVTAAFSSLKLATDGGWLVAVEPGDCTISGRLDCGKVPLHAPWVLKTFQLPVVWRFPKPLRIP